MHPVIVWTSRGAWAPNLTLDVTTATPAERLERVRAVTGGRGVDVGIEASGAPAAVEEAPRLVRDGGRYVIAGHYTDAGPSAINAHHDINRKHLEIRGCWGSEAGHFLRALQVLERHAAVVPFRDIGARIYALDELNQALADAESYAIPKALVAPQQRART